jgi:hypothetical protein
MSTESHEVFRARHLFRALKAEIKTLGCGENCGCVKMTLETARKMKTDGKLKAYLEGRMSLQEAMRLVLLTDAGLDEADVAFLRMMMNVAAALSGGIRSSSATFMRHARPRSGHDAGLHRHGGGHGEVGPDGRVNGAGGH